MSALPPKADIDERDWEVRFVPKADIQKEALARSPYFIAFLQAGSQPYPSALGNVPNHALFVPRAVLCELPS